MYISTVWKRKFVYDLSSACEPLAGDINIRLRECQLNIYSLDDISICCFNSALASCRLLHRAMHIKSVYRDRVLIPRPRRKLHIKKDDWASVMEPKFRIFKKKEVLSHAYKILSFWHEKLQSRWRLLICLNNLLLIYNSAPVIYLLLQVIFDFK